MKMVERFALIVGVALLALALVACPNGNNDSGGELPSLREAWADYFPLGNILANASWGRNDLANPERLNILRRHFDLLTAENEMKPNVVRHGTSYPGTWNWDYAEAQLAFAEREGFRFHGHTLAWHSQSHQWLAQGVTPEVAATRLRNHIETVMMRFGDRVESWDVVNEAIVTGGPGGTNFHLDGRQLNQHGDGFFFPGGTAEANLNWATGWTWRDALRHPLETDGAPSIMSPPPHNRTNWPTAINVPTSHESCFIEIAFRHARYVADREKWDMVLYYNDYNLNIPRKRMPVYYMVRDINDRHREELSGRNLIQAVGMQAHYWLPGTVGGATRHPPVAVCPFEVRDSLVRFASLGVYISITEMDIFAGSGQLREQAIMYARLFNLFRSFAVEHPGILRRVSIWGVDDPSSWRNQYAPLLWGANFQPKEAFWAVLDPDAFLAEHAPQYLNEFAGDNFTEWNWRP
ncbi:MAG: endo-1,4-beta-xylanase [Treponema sp.]|nr:endo-1,4-beta-xylanase [Treponema sp.]